VEYTGVAVEKERYLYARFVNDNGYTIKTVMKTAVAVTRKREYILFLVK